MVPLRLAKYTPPRSRGFLPWSRGCRLVRMLCLSPHRHPMTSISIDLYVLAPPVRTFLNFRNLTESRVFWISGILSLRPPIRFCRFISMNWYFLPRHPQSVPVPVSWAAQGEHLRVFAVLELLDIGETHDIISWKLRRVGSTSSRVVT